MEHIAPQVTVILAKNIGFLVFRDYLFKVILGPKLREVLIHKCQLKKNAMRTNLLFQTFSDSPDFDRYSEVYFKVLNKVRKKLQPLLFSFLISIVVFDDTSSTHSS